MASLVPYEIFLLRRLQQAQRRAAQTGTAGSAEPGIVVPMRRRSKASKRRQKPLAATPEGAHL